MQIFEEVLFLKLRTKQQTNKNKKTEKHTINSTYLVSGGCGRLAEGKGHETDWLTWVSLVPFSFCMRLTQVGQSVSCPFPSASLPHPTDTRWVDFIVCFLFFWLYVAWERGLPRKFARFVLFRLIKKRSFNLLCVLDLNKPSLLVYTIVIIIIKKKQGPVLNFIRLFFKQIDLSIRVGDSGQWAAQCPRKSRKQQQQHVTLITGARGGECLRFTGSTPTRR